MAPYKFVLFAIAGIFHRADDYFKNLCANIEESGGVCVTIDNGLRSAKFAEKPNLKLAKIDINFEVAFSKLIINKVLRIWREEKIIDKNTVIALGGHSKGALIVAKLLNEIECIDKAILWTPAMPFDINILNPSSIKCFTSLLFNPKFWLGFPVKRSFANTKLGIFNSRMKSQDMITAYESSLFYESSLLIRQLAGKPFSFTTQSKVDYNKINADGVVLIADEDKIVPAVGATQFADQLCFKKRTYCGASHDIFWGNPGKQVVSDSIHFLTH